LDDKKRDEVDKATYSAKLIDDLGEEAGLCEWYDGNNKGVNILKRVLDTRYEKYLKTQLITHISTNLQPGKGDGGRNELEELYGARLVSRFNQMFNVIHLGGKDKRG